MATKYSNTFVEFNALEAALSDDTEGMRQVLASMFPTERQALKRAMLDVVDAIDDLD
ncbi:hypothetical protein LT337_32260 (plasmid) [Mycolicibacterium fortuitum]|nr:hypothetical protein LT337_32260 [Mycolicibacterium fortuitum]